MQLSNFIFLLLFLSLISLFSFNLSKIIRNINLGKSFGKIDNKWQRFKNMVFIAFGQSKMKKRPIAGLLHLFVYLGFIIINIEVLEIIIDGVFNTHRVFSFFGNFYNFLIGSFEVLALLVIIACVLFFIRRNFLNIQRLIHKDLKGWPKSDANLILFFEILLMLAFLFMNSSDNVLQERGIYHHAGAFPISNFFTPFVINLSNETLIFVERFCWWFHIIGILLFLNYLVISKHLHIIFAFPNVYFAKLNNLGTMDNMTIVQKEVQMMLNPSQENDLQTQNNEIDRFGAKDVIDLEKLQLLNAYSCTECGRCTAVCPANITGKSLSPRKIMMDTRDRIEYVGKNLIKKGQLQKDDKSLIDDYISREEIWACTACNACVDACPININPMSIVLDLRRYIVMEESKAPSELNNMFNNVENNGSPWPFSPQDRLNWKND